MQKRPSLTVIEEPARDLRYDWNLNSIVTLKRKKRRWKLVFRNPHSEFGFSQTGDQTVTGKTLQITF